MGGGEGGMVHCLPFAGVSVSLRRNDGGREYPLLCCRCLPETSQEWEGEECDGLAGLYGAGAV